MRQAESNVRGIGCPQPNWPPCHASVDVYNELVSGMADTYMYMVFGAKI